MSATTDTGAVDGRTRRAATEAMVVTHEGAGLFNVYTCTDVYAVFIAPERRCGCDDHHYRQATCKHIQRVEMTVGERTIPQVAGVDPVLREQRGGA